MTMKTIAAGVTLTVLALLGLEIGRAFAQQGSVVKPPRGVSGGGQFGANELDATPRPRLSQPSARNVSFAPSMNVGADEESARLIASDAQLQGETQVLLAQYSE